ncbi:MAG TPA: AAA family ATPase, partial [Candidatus Limnocylindrales bacterium]|nr:AAA family ATPase [Candidatus Limnocylindrales bacterium]
MSAPIRILVAVDDGVESELVNASLPSDNGVQIVGVIDGLQESWQTLQEVPTDLLAVVCGDYSDRAITLIDGAVKQRPERPVVVLSDGSPNGFVKRVFEVGADDIVSLPANPEQIAFTFEKAIVRKQGTAGAGGVALAPMICVLGPKGGTGKTLTACNLGVALAGAGNRVAIVDLDLQFGDVALSLGLAPERTIYDLAKSGGSLDADKVAGYLAEHPSGVRVLVAPTRPDHAGAITTEFLREVYAALRASHDFVIVDTPPGFTPEVIASIDSSSHVCVVGMLDSLSLKNTKLGLETLELMGYSRERTRFVLNRADSRVGITRDDVVAIVGRTPDVLVPSDRDIPRSVNEGTPIVQAGRRSDAAKAFGHLAALYETREANGGKR